MSRFVLALDQGTTSSRAILFGRDGAVHAVERRELTQHFPQPGWVEHDPDEIWRSQLAVAQEVMAKAGVGAADIAAIGITNQRETVVVWDKLTGEPVCRAIVWQDRRTAAVCDRLRAEGHTDAVRGKTGLVLDSYFCATKIGWILDNVPDARRRAERGELAFGTVDSWLIYKLSGKHVTDASNASRTLLFNIHTLAWDDELLALFRIPRAMLPEIAPSSGVLAESAALLFGGPIPIAGVAGDQQAATFGQFCLKPGMAKNTYGTGCFMLMNIDGPRIDSRHNLLTTVGWTLARGAHLRTAYMLEGSVFMAGATVQWLRDGLGMIRDASEIEALAASVPDAGGVVFVPAFAGLGAPYWDACARGTIVGMTRGTSKAHIAHAALASIACQAADVMEAIQADSGTMLTELRVDGGAACNNLLMQLQADVLGVPVVRPVVTETTAFGAACLAGLAVGFWSSEEETARLWQVERIFEPHIGADRRAAMLADWRRAVERSRAWVAA